MSGICGWFSRAGVALGQPRLIERMAAPMARFDGCRMQTAMGTRGVGAVVADAPSAAIHEEDDLTILFWGDHPERVPALAAEWRTRGPSACAALRGAFAVAIFDERGGEALLATDRGGMHPMCYELAGDQLLFASSLDALMLHPAALRTLDSQAIYNYLYFHVVPGPSTIYGKARRLEPGEYLHYRGGKAQRGRYWQLLFNERETQPFGELREAFLDTLRGSVREAMGKRRVGAFLSGGTDSSTITAMLGQVTDRPARTYSIGFKALGYDEMAYARIAARHFQTVHHERYVTPDDVRDAIPGIAAAFDQPFGNASAVPAFYCAQMARADGVERLLGGDGGDELFGGNQRYARQALFDRYERIPSALRQLVLEPFLFGPAAASRILLLRKARSYIEQALVPMPARLETYNLMTRYGPAEVMDPEFLAQVDSGMPMASLNEVYWLTHGQSQINQMLALDMKFTLADNDLPKVMRACELAGVEAGFPMLDDALVAFASRLAPRHKLNGTRLRYFFKEALRGTLPPAILDKQKHGFGLPFGLWLTQHAGLRGIALDSLHDLKRRRIVRASFIDELVKTHLAQHPAYHGTMVWVLMMLEQWFVQRDVQHSNRTRHEFACQP